MSAGQLLPGMLSGPPTPPPVPFPTQDVVNLARTNLRKGLSAQVRVGGQEKAGRGLAWPGTLPLCQAGSWPGLHMALPLRCKSCRARCDCGVFNYGPHCHPHMQEVADKLAAVALKRYTADNVAVVVVSLLEQQAGSSSGGGGGGSDNGGGKRKGGLFGLFK